MESKTRGRNKILFLRALAAFLLLGIGAPAFSEYRLCTGCHGIPSGIDGMCVNVDPGAGYPGLSICSCPFGMEICEWPPEPMPPPTHCLVSGAALSNGTFSASCAVGEKADRPGSANPSKARQGTLLRMLLSLRHHLI